MRLISLYVIKSQNSILFAKNIVSCQVILGLSCKIISISTTQSLLISYILTIVQIYIGRIKLYDIKLFNYFKTSLPSINRIHYVHSRLIYILASLIILVMTLEKNLSVKKFVNLQIY